MPVSASEFRRRTEAGTVQAESRFTRPVNETMASGAKIGNLIVTAISDVVHLGGGTIGFNYIGSVTFKGVENSEERIVLAAIDLHSAFGTMSLPQAQPPQGGQNPVPHTIKDLRDSIYNDKALLAKINKCLKQLLTPQQFQQIGNQTRANAPKIDARLSSLDIAKKFGMGHVDKNTGQFVNDPPYATGVGHIGGTNGTIFIGNEWFSDPTQWTQGRRADLPGRSPLENSYVHELGNIISYRISSGTTYGAFGVIGASDEDSGYQLQKCVFGN
jgi:hypothetical protein